jgi:hypothetical protein
MATLDKQQMDKPGLDQSVILPKPSALQASKFMCCASVDSSNHGLEIFKKQNLNSPNHPTLCIVFALY